MFYIVEVKDHVRVEPELFGMPVKDSIHKQLEKNILIILTKSLVRLLL